jgi:O-acetyl-ADP-ribose deacetylase (regulator of RNase III)
MTLQYLTGDLFSSGAQTLGHGVNCRGRMGRGIATEFKARFPAMFKEYRRRCHSGELQPGEVYLEKGTTPWVLNLATQATTGGARLEYIEQCACWVADHHEREGIVNLALPRLGSGLGGLEWSDVEGVLEQYLGGISLPVTVYQL